MVSVAIVLAPTGDLAVPALGATIAIDLVVFGAIWLSMRPGAADITFVFGTPHSGQVPLAGEW